MTPQAIRGDGQVVPPGAAVVPVLKEIAVGQLKVVGTAFFVTRYGLFASAKHVLEDLVSDWVSRRIDTAFVLEHVTETEFSLRRIVGVSLSSFADVGVGQADNGIGANSSPGNERANLAVRLSFDAPEDGESLKTFAYPENKVMDFRDPDVPPTLHGDYFTGSFLAHVEGGTRPPIPQHHFDTSLEIRSGASGGPVFNSRGRAVAIASRGWDFRGGEHEQNPLSSVLPVSLLLPLEVGCARIPNSGWEYNQIPEPRRGVPLTFGELVAYEHIDVGTRSLARAPGLEHSDPTN